jgi:serine/threonine protein kinase
MDDATRLAGCPRCGGTLPVDAPGGLCPACLLALAGPANDQTISTEATHAFGSPSGTEDATVLSAGSDASAGRPRVDLTPGQLFGPYRIEKLLGKGGMGEVYAAEHLEHGRRLALKVLTRRLDRDDRARFLREGQLAASLNHPRSVYIFGSEEIDGTPVITMELVPGGTLKAEPAGRMG